MLQVYKPYVGLATQFQDLEEASTHVLEPRVLVTETFKSQNKWVSRTGTFLRQVW